jgi:uncharacterized protein YjbJ (UPF0337 family)
MKNKQKGFLGLGILIILGLVLVGGGVYVYTNQKTEVNVATDTEINATSTPVSTDNKDTMEVKLNESKNTINESVGKNLVTDASVKIDTKGNPIPSLTVNPDVATDLVVAKYGGEDSAYMRQLIEVGWKALGSGLMAESSIKRNATGSYIESCDGAVEYLETKVKENLEQDKEEGGLLKKIGITLESYNLNQFTCKDSKNGFVASVPVVLRDNTKTQFCMSSSGSGFGEANFDTMTCIKK